nr:reverse transcriptase domain-containing protein [Tanacetum cinerariifolium]
MVDEPELGKPKLDKLVLGKLEVGFDFAFSAAIFVLEEEVIELDDLLHWAEVSQSLCVDSITMSQSQTNRNNQNQNFHNQNRNQGNIHSQGNNQGRNQFFQGASRGQNLPPAYQAPPYQVPSYQAPVYQPQIPQPGTAYQGPTIPTTPSSLPPVVERETEVTKDTVPPANNRSTKDVQPPVVQTETPIQNSEPVVAPIIEPVVAP